MGAGDTVGAGRAVGSLEAGVAKRQRTRRCDGFWFSGMPALVDMRGKQDRNGYTLRVTVIAAADELAAGASLMMGQASEGTPVVLARGFPYELAEDQASRLVRSKQSDLFR